ncbi:MAG: hypothetical protein JWN41_1236, partial [Thermoleophilia bacterium]|nr:hypothetical protein [Thermoleophilia bacterium]
MAVLAGVGVGLMFIPTSDVAYAPADPINLEGHVTIDGRPLPPLQGRIYLVGVTERRINLLQRGVLGVADSSIDFDKAPAGVQGAGGPTTGDIQAMAQAKSFAAAVVYQLVSGGQSVRWSGAAATIVATQPGTPAAAQLRPGDVIAQMNGVSYDNAVDLQRRLFQMPPGSRVTLFVRRGGEAIKVVLRTIPPVAGDTDHRSRVGVTMDTLGLRVALPHRVS